MLGLKPIWEQNLHDNNHSKAKELFPNHMFDDAYAELEHDRKVRIQRMIDAAFANKQPAFSFN